MEETQVVITTYRVPAAKVKGLHVNHCHCGDHVWCLPFNESLTKWESHQRSPIRDIVEKHGMAPPEPTASHHVILASPQDAHLVSERKWRVFPSRMRTRHKIELRGGTRRGLPLQRLIMGREACVRIVNRNGCDVRRENLKQMTRKEIAADRRGRKTVAVVA